MKKHILALFFLPSLLLSCGTSSSNSLSSILSGPSSSSESPQSVQLFLDNSFSYGFTASPADASFDDGSIPDNRWSLDSKLTFGEHKKDKPMWGLHQYGCRYGLGDIYNITTTSEATLDNGTYTFADPSKSIGINPEKKSLRFELNASKEYQHPRRSMEAWPHLIIDSSLSETIQISELESLDFSVDLTLTKLENKMAEGTYDTNLHTVQFIMYFICNTASSLDANDFLWFGVPFLDYRYKVIAETGLVDYGTAGNTGKYIYSMSSASYLPNGLEIGKKNEIRLDLKDEFGTGLLKAQSDGYLVNSTLNDLSITYLNIGYEVPGTFDSAISIENFSLVAAKK